MKKVFWKAAGLMTVLLILSLVLAGCGNSAKKMAGTYRATYNMKEAMNKELEPAGMALSSDIDADFILELKEDGSFIFDIDGEGFSSRFTEIIQTEGRSIIDSMLQEQGVTEDMYDLIAETSGYESYEAFVDGMIGMIEEEMGDQFVKELETATHLEGTYSVEKDRLVITGGTGEGTGMDEGTINEDGSISVVSEMQDGMTLDLRFIKQ